MSADGDIVRGFMHEEMVTYDEALGALARLEAAEAQAFDDGCAAVRDEPVCNVCGQNHDRDESAACEGCEPISFGELPERLREVVAQRDALAGALLKIANGFYGGASVKARAALAEAGLE